MNMKQEITNTNLEDVFSKKIDGYLVSGRGSVYNRRM